MAAKKKATTRQNLRAATKVAASLAKSVAQKRDTTRALNLAKQLRERLAGAHTAGDPSLGWAEELVLTLTDMDARTGKRDPSKRTKRK